MLPHGFSPFILAALHERNAGTHAQAWDWPLWHAWGLLVIQEGSLQIETKAGTRIATEKDMVLAQPGRLLRLHQPDQVRFWRLTFDVVPRPRRLTTTGQSWMAQDSSSQPDATALWGADLPFMLPAICWSRTQVLVRRIADRWWRGEVDQFLCNTLLSAWFGWIVDTLIRPQLTSQQVGYREAEAPAPSQTSDDPVVAAAEESARRGFSHGLTVADLATEAGMDRDAFTRRYQRARGTTPGAMLCELRYTLAQRLLLDSPHTVQHVARLVGFRSVSAFVRGFRQRHGLTPSAFRRQGTVD